jgi:hypothetical protein
MCNISLSEVQTYIVKGEKFLIVLVCHTSPLIFHKLHSVSGCCGLIFSPACYLLNFPTNKIFVPQEYIMIRIKIVGQQLAFDFTSTRYEAQG